MLTKRVDEKSSCTYTATLKDRSGVVIPLADITALTFSLYSLEDPTRAAINSRTAQSILNVNGGTMHATSGLLTIEIGPADNVIVDSSLAQERHLAEVRWTYNGGNSIGSTTFMIVVSNLTKVT
jgi:hypothetical protein